MSKPVARAQTDEQHWGLLKQTFCFESIQNSRILSRNQQPENFSLDLDLALALVHATRFTILNPYFPSCTVLLGTLNSYL